MQSFALMSRIPLRGSPPPGTKGRCGVCQDDDNGDSRGEPRRSRSPGFAGGQCVADATSRPEDWRSAGRKGSDRAYEGAMPARRRRRRSPASIRRSERVAPAGRVEDANAASGARRRVFLNSGGQDASSRKGVAEAEGCGAVPWRLPHPLGAALHKQRVRVRRAPVAAGRHTEHPGTNVDTAVRKTLESRVFRRGSRAVKGNRL